MMTTSMIDDSSDNENSPNYSSSSHPVWEVVIKGYHENDTTSFKLYDLYKALPTVTEARVQKLCQELENAGKLTLSSGRSRIITYDIVPEHLPAKKSSVATSVSKPRLVDVEVVAAVKKALKPRSEPDISSSADAKVKKVKPLGNAGESSSSFKTPSAKAKEDTSPSSIVFVNNATASPAESFMDKVSALIVSLSQNHSLDTVKMSELRSKCLEQAISEGMMMECLQALDHKNKIMLDTEEIFIL
jgi:hypothetical protein